MGARKSRRTFRMDSSWPWAPMLPHHCCSRNNRHPNRRIWPTTAPKSPQLRSRHPNEPGNPYVRRCYTIRTTTTHFGRHITNRASARRCHVTKPNPHRLRKNGRPQHYYISRYHYQHPQHIDARLSHLKNFEINQFFTQNTKIRPITTHPHSANSPWTFRH